MNVTIITRIETRISDAHPSLFKDHYQMRAYYNYTFRLIDIGMKSENH